MRAKEFITAARKIDWENFFPNVSTTTRLIMIEAALSQDVSLCEINSDSATDYFNSLADMSVKPKKGKYYICLFAALIHNEFIVYSGPERVKIISSENDAYTVNDGKKVKNYIKNYYAPTNLPGAKINARAETFFFNNVNDYDMFRTAVKLKFNKDLSQVGKISEDIQAFHSDTTEMPYYDNMMQNPEYFRDAKGLESELGTMSPKEYIQRVSDSFGKPVDVITGQRDPELVDKYAQKMKDGEKFPILTLDYSRGSRVSQEGIHRSMAAIKIGLIEVPVLIVTSID